MNLDATCGTSDERNHNFNHKFNIKLLYQELFGSRSSPLIFDIGAHKGESIDHFSKIFPLPKIHSFEPDPESFSYLSSHFQKHPSVVAINNLALSSKSGSSVYYRQQLSHLGGLSKVNISSTDSLGFAATASNQHIDVSTTTLDEYCKLHKINSIDLVKIDVQGHEYDVLLGAQLSLDSIKCFAIEICLFDFYEQKSDISNIFNMLYAHNFTLYSIPKISQNPSNYRSDWFEAIFIK